MKIPYVFFFLGFATLLHNRINQYDDARVTLPENPAILQVKVAHPEICVSVWTQLDLLAS